MITNTHRTAYSPIAFAAASEGNGTDANTDAADDNTGTEEPSDPSDNSNRLTPIFDKDRLDRIKANMADREIFSTLDAAGEKLQKAAAATDNFFGLPVAIRGADKDGNIDESVYQGMRAVLAYVGTRGKNDKNEAVTGIKGVVLFPVPTLEDFLASEVGKGLVNKAVDKELALAAFRPVRDAGSVFAFTNGVESMPVTVEEFATAATRGVDTTAFDTLWPGLREAVKNRKRDLFDVLPNKKTFLDALRSKAFAESNEDTTALEKLGWIVKLGQMLVAAGPTNVDKDGKPAPIDTSLIADWLKERDSFVFERTGPKPKDFSKLSGSLDF